ncbi:MAG: Gfo/Idh/MocA family oxidoreductase, partial [Acidimicrobiales bacterium]|nr:Gfo/Idh/MocA family oxidoreductase [Acidimicrobiales bacterium]
MMPFLRIGIVGCGRLARQGYVPALAGMPALQVVAVADPDPVRRSLVAAAVGGSPAQLTSASELVAAGPIDAVLIASPVDQHVDDAAMASSAGLPALLEKPPARDAATASQLASLEVGPYLGFNRRFDPGARAARDARADLASCTLDLALHYRRASWAPYQVDDDAL